MSPDRCEECRYFVTVDSGGKKEEEALGECCRFPPTLYGEVDEQQQLQGRPFVWSSEFCGEFARRLDS